MNTPIRGWKGQRVWIIGASSGIGAALAAALLQRGAHVAVSARRAEAMRALAADHKEARVLPFDLNDRTAFAAAADDLFKAWGGIDLVVFCAGAYAPMRAWQLDANDIDRMLDINLRAPMAASARLIPQLLKQGSGALAFVSSVAGFRGLPKAAAYGPTKAALINFAETLYLDLAPRGLSVFIINPGFVATPMTAANDFEMPALISPQQAAEEIIAGFGRGSFEIHFPRRFTAWLKLLRLLPYSLYFALVRRFTRL
ncbi:MAG: SDR family NAD(P)-dependent oxidoreductase [Sulfuritalea sp.]|jgi:short-subunit dehydrogenase|nr:SDR family NAD(P)-dependent oxidoreductase [Sulfuritalea sp.]